MKRYPKFVYDNKLQDEFNSVMVQITKQCILIKDTTPILDYLKSLSNDVYYKNISKIIPFITKILDVWNENNKDDDDVIINKQFVINDEEEESVTCDITTKVAVYCVVITTSKIFNQSLLDDYKKISQLNNLKIGIILPISGVVCFVESQSDVVNNDDENDNKQRFSNVQILTRLRLSNIGFHLKKKKSISNTILQFIKSYDGSLIPPFQMFLASPRKTNNTKLLCDKTNHTNISDNLFCRFKSQIDDDLNIAKDIIGNNNLLFFVHSSYMINLCRSLDWAKQLLKSDIINTMKVHGQGVVVHVGKSVDIPLLEALQTMKSMLEEITQETQCPDRFLLLETPAGQKSETLTELKDFALFVEQFKGRIGICVDTCHIYACGYCDPVAYLEQLSDYCSQPVSLVHFNDSKDHCNSKHDRHEIPFNGHIGEKLDSVITFCKKHSIPMVVEQPSSTISLI